MKVAVVGLGSMGKRRIRLIKSNFEDIEIIGIDMNGERCREAEDLFGISTSGDSDDVFANGDIDGVFISTSPLSHSKIIRSALSNGLNVFTEINLVDDLYDENIALAGEKAATLFLSSTQLYRKEIGYMADFVKDADKPTSYIYHIGNYLPDWHPWESYKNFFVGNRKTNGCREILAIELPWIIDAFGDAERVYVTKNKMSALEIDYPDNFMVTIEHKSGDRGVLIVDLVSRKPVRNLEIINEDFYFSWNGSPEGLERYNIEEAVGESINLYEDIEVEDSYNQTIIENAYLEEIIDFFDAVSNEKAHGKYSFEKDKYVLNLIDIIESAEDTKAYKID